MKGLAARGRGRPDHRPRPLPGPGSESWHIAQKKLLHANPWAVRLENARAATQFGGRLTRYEGLDSPNGSASRRRSVRKNSECRDGLERPRRNEHAALHFTYNTRRDQPLENALPCLGRDTQPFAKRVKRERHTGIL